LLEVLAHIEIAAQDREPQEDKFAYEEQLKVPWQLASFEKIVPARNKTS
jgi:hypothetical protein